MKILIQSRVDLFEKYGGDTTQIIKIAEYLKKINIDVNISTKLKENLKDYDLVHLFNISPRVHETYIQCLNAKSQHKLIILSLLYHDPQEIIEYDQKNRFGLLKLLSKLTPSLSTKEILKNLFRGIKDKRQLAACLKQLLVGYKKQQKKVLELSDYYIADAHHEIEQIKKDFNISRPYSVVPKAAEKTFADANPTSFINKYKLKNFVLCVGRIETRKNQLAVIQALQNTDLKLVIIGKINPLHKIYFKRIKEKIKKNKDILYIPCIPHEELGSAYAAAKVHILASWYEVVPLVDWEAGLAGCNVVTTIKGYGKEYLKDMVWYCDPANVDSIRQAVLAAFQAPKSDQLKNYILENFSWEKTAQKTLEAYEKVLSR